MTTIEITALETERKRLVSTLTMDYMVEFTRGHARIAVIDTLLAVDDNDAYERYLMQAEFTDKTAEIKAAFDKQELDEMFARNYYAR